MECRHYDVGECRSCVWLRTSYEEQVAAKQRHALDALGDLPGAAMIEWLEPVRSSESAFRNKAKMVVAGTVAAPTLGILGPDGRGVDLRDCGIHERALQRVLPVLAEFVTVARLVPYDIAIRRGELKFVLVTAAPDGTVMVRFVCRSREPVTRIQKHLPWLMERLPADPVVTVNVQPVHKAVVEGSVEIPLTGRTRLRIGINGHHLFLAPGAFFQTNTSVAAMLYRQAVAWATDVETVWDLYCGVGGFAIHLAAPGRSVIGVEESEPAVTAATLAAREATPSGIEFHAGDATAWALERGDAPDLVVVNPPRRGIGPNLAGWIQRSGVGRVLYSSCNPTTLAGDLATMPGLRPVRARLFDMFPHTDHVEVLVDLRRD